MARRRIVEEPVSHERWLVSYADFITLLFAFFVVMYSISQVNEGKYKILSNTLSEVFTTAQIAALKDPERTLDPFQVGEIAKSNPQHLIKIAAENASTDHHLKNEGQANASSFRAGNLNSELKQINGHIDQAFGDLIRDEKVTVRGNEEWLEVELKSSLLFSSGDATLSVPALELLGSIAEILKRQSSSIRVEGFTDNQPINTPRFPSNWELSTARAASVVQLFIEEGIDPSRLAAIGYGEFQPVSDNDSEEGRAENRRVVLMISKTDALRPALRAITSTENLVSRSESELAPTPQPTGIDIIIPGVSKAGQVATPATPAAAMSPLQGIKTIVLDNGGLLFTNDGLRKN
ncbi:flagellar motor protein MotD [uncultured Oceanicoccus sp.]|uniref:flagellar motor protein MotD n=1 Tax=uncultured Oceanicoccus sp. TaxID=1706381 RepID=UPI0030D73AAD